MTSNPINQPSATFLELAKFVHDLEIGCIPEAVIRRVDYVLMDLIASTYASLGGDGSRSLWRYATQIGNREEATLWGTSKKVSVTEAATVNGSIAYEAEFDDGNSMGGHWGSSSIPAIVALAERQASSAEDFLVSIVAAYEIGNRISSALSKPMLDKGIHFPGAMGSLAAIAGTGRILRRSPAVIAGALGLASLSPLAPYYPSLIGSVSKNLYSGWANHCGIHYVELASAGYCGPANLLEGRDGLAQALGWTEGSAELRRRVLHGLGVNFAIADTYFKPFPCCRWLHAPIQAIQEIRERFGLNALDIQSICVKGPGFLNMYMGDEPSTGGQAKYSLPYCVAAAVMHENLGQAHFLDAALADGSTNTLARAVRFEKDPALDQRFPHDFSTFVEVALKNGTLYQSQSRPKWGKDNPPSFDELAGKFERIMTQRCGAGLAQEWLSYFKRGILADPDMSAFFALLHASKV